METLFDLLPKELIYIISNDLNYEDIKNLQEVLSFDILKSVRVVKCEKKYNINNFDGTCTPQTHNFAKQNNADKCKLSNFSYQTKYIDNGILISIQSPSDFEELLNYTSLINCNFILPHNKYESIPEFESYLEVFFDVLFRIKFKENIKYKDLNYRILFQSDYNHELGITMNSGCITLINSEYYIGFSSDTQTHINNLDYVINIINKYNKKYDKGIYLFYTKQTDEFTYIHENDMVYDYIDNGIYPLTVAPQLKPDNTSKVYKILKDNIKMEEYNEDEKIQEFNEDSDYLCVIVKYSTLSDNSIGSMDETVFGLGFIKSILDIMNPYIDTNKFNKLYKRGNIKYFLESLDDEEVKSHVISLIKSKLNEYKVIYDYDHMFKARVLNEDESNDENKSGDESDEESIGTDMILKVYNQKYNTDNFYEHMYFDVYDIERYTYGINSDYDEFKAKWYKK
jgi:hypothetical protein